MAGSMGVTRRRKVKTVEAPKTSIADVYKERLGYKPSLKPFFTTANVMCGRCRQIKPGSDFPQPIPLPASCTACSTTEGRY